MTEKPKEQQEQTQPPKEQKPKAPEKLTASPSSEAKYGYWWGTGRRKSSVARVRIKPGEGKLMINKRELDNYFARPQDRNSVMAPLKATHCDKLFDVFINVKGGGTTGQAGAAMLGIARALKTFDDNYLPVLREGGYLTRDSRMVERKKYGRAGARKRFQFSKR